MTVCKQLVEGCWLLEKAKRSFTPQKQFFWRAIFLRINNYRCKSGSIELCDVDSLVKLGNGLKSHDEVCFHVAFSAWSSYHEWKLPRDHNFILAGGDEREAMTASHRLYVHGREEVVFGGRASVLLMIEPKLPELICTPEVAKIIFGQKPDMMISCTELTNFDTQFLVCLETDFRRLPVRISVATAQRMPKDVV